jgi:hypothetical protein
MLKTSRKHSLTRLHSRYPRQKKLLVSEFNVQVFSNGEIAWDNLDKFITTDLLQPNSLVLKLSAINRKRAGAPVKRKKR